MSVETMPRQRIEIKEYQPVRAEIEALKAENSALVFQYDTPSGNKNARSHVYKIRQKRADVERVRKEAKAQALDYGRRVDAVAGELVYELDQMIAVHQRPLDQIENARMMAAKAEADRIAIEKAETERKAKAEADAILAAERDKAAKLQAELDALRRHERDEQIRREAEDLARRDAEVKLAKEREEAAAREQAQRHALLAAERARLEDERLALEQERRAVANAKAAAERADREKVEAAAKAERDRTAAEDRAKREQAEAVQRVLDDAARKERDEQAAAAVEAKWAADAEAARLKQQQVRERIVERMVMTLVSIAPLPHLDAVQISEAILDGKIEGVSYSE